MIVEPRIPIVRGREGVIGVEARRRSLFLFLWLPGSICVRRGSWIIFCFVCGAVLTSSGLYGMVPPFSFVPYRSPVTVSSVRLPWSFLVRYGSSGTFHAIWCSPNAGQQCCPSKRRKTLGGDDSQYCFVVVFVFLSHFFTFFFTGVGIVVYA